jgi:hypothetical protein
MLSETTPGAGQAAAAYNAFGIDFAERATLDRCAGDAQVTLRRARVAARRALRSGSAIFCPEQRFRVYLDASVMHFFVKLSLAAP